MLRVYRRIDAQEFRDHGVEMMGPAAELLQTSKKWSSNFQRDMMRKANRYGASQQHSKGYSLKNQLIREPHA